MNIYRLLQTHHVDPPLPVELTSLEGIQATCLPPTMHRSPGTQTQDPGFLSHIIPIQAIATLVVTVTMVGPPETTEAMSMEILIMATATLDVRKAVTLGILLRINGDLTLQLTLRTLVLIHGDLTLRGALMLHAPVYRHGCMILQVAMTLDAPMQIQGYAMPGPFHLPHPDGDMSMLQRRLGRRFDRLGIPRARRDEWVESN